MKKIISLICGCLLITQSCEPKKEITQDKTVVHPSYESALDVPVNNVAVVINIDSLGVFDHNSQELKNKIPSKNIEDQIMHLNSTLDIAKLIKEKSIEILTENNYQYKIIDSKNLVGIPTDLITQETINKVNFTQLKSNFTQDDLILINVKTGLDYQTENKQIYAAKTYIYMNIFDLKNHTLKYSETIGGTKYMEESVQQLTIKQLEKLLRDSLSETLEMIDQD